MANVLRLEENTKILSPRLLYYTRERHHSCLTGLGHRIRPGFCRPRQKNAKDISWAARRIQREDCRTWTTDSRLMLLRRCSFHMVFFRLFRSLCQANRPLLQSSTSALVQGTILLRQIPNSLAARVQMIPARSPCNQWKSLTLHRSLGLKRLSLSRWTGYQVVETGPLSSEDQSFGLSVLDSCCPSKLSRSAPAL